MGHKLYEQLGVPRECSMDELKKAYRKLAVQHHPDKGGDPEKFKELSHAYQILSDEEQRRRYDQLGDENFDSGGMPHGDPMNIFEHFFGGGGPFGGGFFGNGPFGPGGPFGGGPPQRPPCRHLHHTIAIPLRDAIFGCEKHIKITLHKKCFKCLDSCGACQGRGQITEMQRMGPFTNIATRPCPSCRGAGQTAKMNKNCGDCCGSGEIKEEKKLDVKIPSGVETGWQRVFNGYGEQAQMPGDTPGNLVLEVLVQPDPIFERRGPDLIYKHKISLVDSICGKQLEIPMYTGPVHINTREWGIIQPGKEYRVEGEKLIVLFTIEYPTKMLQDSDVEAIRHALT